MLNSKKIAILYSSQNPLGQTAGVAQIMFKHINSNQNSKATAKIFYLNDYFHNNFETSEARKDSIEALLCELDECDFMLFGSPTYMGSVHSKFKEFEEATSSRWFTQKWQDKLSSGFTNSGFPSGDKLSVLQQMNIFAMQHGMIWISLGVSNNAHKLKKNEDGTVADGNIELNALGGYIGLMTQSGRKDSNGNNIVLPTDSATAIAFADRIVDVLSKFHTYQNSNTESKTESKTENQHRS